jgi:four helix bundle protein
MGKIQKFTDLIAWQKAHRFVLEIYQLTKSFPPDERFGLIDQMRRAAVSVPSNIAEGFSRGTAKDKIQFYSIAKGSLTELLSQLYIAQDLGYMKDAREMIGMGEEIERIIAGLIKSSPARLSA